MKRDRHQRAAYAMRRMSQAVDRGIVTMDQGKKAKANRWAAAWARAAGIRPAPAYRLDQLLDGMNEDNRHQETRWGPDVGNEVIGD